MIQDINELLEQKIVLLKQLENSDYMKAVCEAVDVLCEALEKNKKILLAGNGGSAADAQHFAGEMVGRFMMERKSMSAMSLCVDPSVMTCIGNDYGYEEVFARQVEGMGEEGDCLIVISTSGNSENLWRAAVRAKQKNMMVIGFLGKTGGKLAELCDHALIVPSDSTPRIQEIHTLTVHIMCEWIEKRMVLGDANGVENAEKGRDGEEREGT